MTRCSPQPHRVICFRQLPIESSEREVSGAAGDLEDCAVGEIAADAVAIEPYGGGDDVGIPSGEA